MGRWKERIDGFSDGSEVAVGKADVNVDFVEVVPANASGYRICTRR